MGDAFTASSDSASGQTHPQGQYSPTACSGCRDQWTVRRRKVELSLKRTIAKTFSFPRGDEFMIRPVFTDARSPW